MSYTRFGYPAAFATEGNPQHGPFPGDFNPYVHGVNDTMDVDDDTGFFSLDVSLHFNIFFGHLLNISSIWRDSQS
jgi:leucyl aminopeptidase